MHVGLDLVPVEQFHILPPAKVLVPHARQLLTGMRCQGDCGLAHEGEVRIDALRIDEVGDLLEVLPSQPQEITHLPGPQRLPVGDAMSERC